MYRDPETSTSVGIALSSMCGDALGAAVNGAREDQIARRFPRGVNEMQVTHMGTGCYTDTTQVLSNIVVVIAILLAP